jgi:hypothetical protein
MNQPQNRDYFLAVLGFEIRAYHLGGRCTTTWATPSPRKDTCGDDKRTFSNCIYNAIVNKQKYNKIT